MFKRPELQAAYPAQRVATQALGEKTLFGVELPEKRTVDRSGTVLIVITFMNTNQAKTKWVAYCTGLGYSKSATTIMQNTESTQRGKSMYKMAPQKLELGDVAQNQ
jgi:hypothetical protein